ncbi:Proline iminopeptidase [hydrothermal vent metagenome]|uniref:prolyl aminopeptidase n=1 Tax=hydrothermal vent metagenome TaxID=652676 RepID=A0A3B1ASE9_9ZZZZ
MADLYPNIRPYASHTLEVDDRHRVYVEECGVPDGIPVLFLHGGPGAGCERYHRCFFDPYRYRIVLFDQRGCGRSQPHADLTDNTTDHLLGDIEAIREMLGIEKWLLFGGSWGSTLALVYAERYPELVSGLVLRGIFLCREQEISWFYQEGASRIFPDYWQDFVAPIPVDERDNLLLAYHRRLTGDDELARMAAAKAWSLWEGRTASLQANKSIIEHFGSPHTAFSVARIECHYFVNNAFLKPNQLLEDAARIADIPGIIVQGRYDLICPVESAWELHKAWPKSELKIVPDAGHSAAETGISSALVDAVDWFADQLE